LVSFDGVGHGHSIVNQKPPLLGRPDDYSSERWSFMLVYNLSRRKGFVR
jgi:hypothetical protein